MGQRVALPDYSLRKKTKVDFIAAFRLYERPRSVSSVQLKGSFYRNVRRHRLAIHDSWRKAHTFNLIRDYTYQFRFQPDHRLAINRLSFRKLGVTRFGWNTNGIGEIGSR